ncbi:MAG: DUF1801 domain-containing protein [Candidatus Saccharibacteria bacterium]|nr:DUF1801 domain-containing protein [Candidatus Saccharibacteria bacterium]
MNKDIIAYNKAQDETNRDTCDLLAGEIQKALEGKTTSKIWHGAPVWFSDGNPIAGYDVLKNCVRLLFWSGQAFDESGLKVEGSFKAAEARYTSPDQVNTDDLQRWLQKALDIQYNYKDIVKNRGQLDRLK